MPNHPRLRRLMALSVSGFMIICALLVGSVPASAKDQSLTNLAHLDFLLDQVSPGAIDGHTTYRLDAEPTLIMPWTYADARPGGNFERIGGGPLDPATGHFGQGAYNTDDIARAAVVYLRDWQQSKDKASRDKAYELLRSVAYMQTDSGPNAGNVVLWMQSDGTLNPSAEPVELPDPSDSGDSFWLARALWAFGEGYAAFQRTDPKFAAFLQDRIALAVSALNREPLNKFGSYEISDGERQPAWLIGNGSDATSEGVIGLAAYVEAGGKDQASRIALNHLVSGIAEMSAGDQTAWPYGAVKPSTELISAWHAWASQTGAALAVGAQALGDRSYLKAAIADTAIFQPTLLTGGGADNGWFPSPTDHTQIAYGVDSRVQSLLAVAAATGKGQGFKDLAALQASWFFGANRSGQAIYDPATGVTYDGVAADGTINKNSGAESTIHGLLTMLALDAHPDVRKAALARVSAGDYDGLKLVEAESAETDGTIHTPTSSWTGESSISGQTVQLGVGQYADFTLPPATRQQLIEPVSWQAEGGSAVSSWSQGGRQLGTVEHGAGAQGISEVPGVLLPDSLQNRANPGDGPVRVVATEGIVNLDAILVRPLISSGRWVGEQGSTELLHSASTQTELISVGSVGERSTVRGYDSHGQLQTRLKLKGEQTIEIAPGGFVVVIQD